MVRGGILPEGTALVDHRNAPPLAYTQCGDTVQCWRVRVQQVWSLLLDDRIQPPLQISNDAPLLKHRQSRRGSRWRRCAIEAQAVDLFNRRSCRPLFARGQLHRAPAQRRLLRQDGSGTKGVAAVQRDRMIKDVQDLHSGRLGLVALRLRRGTELSFQECLEHQ
jgi:hypothetical protein